MAAFGFKGFIYFTQILACFSSFLNDPKLIADKLNRLQFKNLGIVKKDDVFVWKEQPCSYLEPENVTDIWHAWQTSGKFNYMYKRLENGTLVPPPIGMRSSVPLGGISTGFVELRADGSFHEWSIMNQTPAGGAKIPVYDDAFLAVSWSVNKLKAKKNLFFNNKRKSWFKTILHTNRFNSVYKMDQTNSFFTNPSSTQTLSTGFLSLRTHPSVNMKRAQISGVQALEYSGAYPVSRLRVVDNRMPFNLTVYAMSRYSVDNMNFSAMPSVIFLPVVENAQKDVLVTFHFVSPHGIEKTTQRLHAPLYGAKSKYFKPQYKQFKIGSELECFKYCHTRYATCKSWTFNDGMCFLFNIANLNSFNESSSSGVKGFWTGIDKRDNIECLSLVRQGNMAPNGNLSLCTVTSAPGTFYSFDSLKDWRPSSTCKSHGSSHKSCILRQKSHGRVNVYGSISLGNTDVRAGVKQALQPLILAWFYPNRDFLGKVFGNFYANLYSDSLDVASQSHDHMNQMVDDILTLNGVFYNSSLPEFLQDILLNSISHVRSAMWFKDGRWRQWEAFDCANLDSVHNDGERHVPYMAFIPESIKNKMIAWGKSQLDTGRIPEQLACGCSTINDRRIIDNPCGRVMSDVSSMFIVYLLELYRWGNESEFTKQMWPYAKRAAQWHLDEAAENGTIKHMVTTYDILHLSAYDYSAYSTGFHLLALAAAENLANAMGDKEFAGVCRQAFVRAQDVLDNEQWNVTGDYYNAYTQYNSSVKVWKQYVPKLGRVLEIDPTLSPAGAIMTDSFYSQVLAYSNGLGLMLKQSNRLLMHLKAEYEDNYTPYGLLVMTGRYKYPGPFQDNAVWQMGNPNWATLMIHLGQNVNQSLDVAKQTLDAWRTKVNDEWNAAGITGGIGYGAEGQPYATSHYGYYMSSWHLVMALSGQQADLPNGVLRFHPKSDPPYMYPVLLAGTTGTIASSNSTMSEFCVKLGRSLSLRQIFINGKAWPYASRRVNAGQCVSWNF